VSTDSADGETIINGECLYSAAKAAPYKQTCTGSHQKWTTTEPNP
jgi:hypothetical protein